MDKRLLALNVTGGGNSASGAEAVTAGSEVVLKIVSKFLDVLEGAAIIAVGFIIVHFVRRYFARIETAHEHQRTALNLLEKITNGFIVVIAITFGLKTVGLDLTLLLSVLTLGVSFGLRDVIKNYIAGILILFKSPFKIGDTVKIRKFLGKIDKIEFQSITIRAFDGKYITIYNKDILTQPITNFSTGKHRRMEVDVTLGYGSDVFRAVKLIERIMFDDPNILNRPRYSVFFKSFENSGIVLRVRFWVNYPCNILKIQSELAYRIQEALDDYRLLVPYIREMDENFGMTEQRKKRLKELYDQPQLAEILVDTMNMALQTAGAIMPAVAVASNVSNGAVANDATIAVAVTGAAAEEQENYTDADEPE